MIQVLLIVIGLAVGSNFLTWGIMKANQVTAVYQARQTTRLAEQQKCKVAIQGIGNANQTKVDIGNRSDAEYVPDDDIIRLCKGRASCREHNR